MHNKIKLLKEENRRFSDKMVFMREKKRQQFHEIELLEDKLGQLKKKKKEMKRKIVILQNQQDNQTNLISRQIENSKENAIRHLAAFLQLLK